MMNDFVRSVYIVTFLTFSLFLNPVYKCLMRHIPRPSPSSSLPPSLKLKRIPPILLLLLLQLRTSLSSLPPSLVGWA